jgi:polysaccharide deacetylase family protein (PEP-CTERM system associated)
MTLNAFTVDVEDWFHGIDPDPARWHLYERRCHKGVERLLELLDRYETKATFFVLGDVARHQPGIVREIDRRGHEIGCHGMVHRRVSTMTPDQFASDLGQAMTLLAEITGRKVTAFRAPYFSIGPAMDWAFDVLAQAGIEHDSSIFPARAPHYGSPGAPRAPHRIRPGMVEWPVSVASFGRWAFPFAGGAYFRILPRGLFAALLAKHRLSRLPFIFYTHPWELDPDHPRADLPLEPRLRHYTNLARTEAKLGWLLGKRRFGPLSSLAFDGGQRQAAAAPVAVAARPIMRATGDR